MTDEQQMRIQCVWCGGRNILPRYDQEFMRKERDSAYKRGYDEGYKNGGVARDLAPKDWVPLCYTQNKCFNCTGTHCPYIKREQATNVKKDATAWRERSFK